MSFTAIAVIGVFSSIGIGFWMMYLLNKEMNNNFKKYKAQRNKQNQ